ncbi:MAG: hypothetical protein HYS12_12985 [Planctomycetes bacterium]|nr:hypothetical protein [Planctomycetota bacterium]
MVAVDTSLARDALRRLAGISDGAKKRLRSVLEAIEADPSQFDELDDIPIPLPVGVTLRKAKVTGQNYDWRLILIHYHGHGGHVRVFCAFDRKAGYTIDWRAATALAGEETADPEDG